MDRSKARRDNMVAIDEIGRIENSNVFHRLVASKIAWGEHAPPVIFPDLEMQVGPCIWKSIGAFDISDSRNCRTSTDLRLADYGWDNLTIHICGARASVECGNVSIYGIVDLSVTLVPQNNLISPCVRIGRIHNADQRTVRHCVNTFP